MSRYCTISRTVPLAESAKSFLCDYEDNNEDKIMSGIFSNLKYVWYASGRRVQVIESRTGKRVASWTFDPLSKDNTRIIYLSEIPCLSKEIPLLIIGLECALTGGTICIFDILTSKILRSIQMKDIVSYIHIIDCGSNIFPILGPLNTFDGVVAVGLVGGDVLLVDLCQQCIDDARASNAAEDFIGEIDVCQIIPLTIKDIHAIEDHKQKAIQSGSHLSIILNDVLNTKLPHFILKGPKGEDRIRFNKADVLVTSLFYSPQLGSLLVGYNFGAWQIWNIVNMTLVYTSPVYEENIPVSHFAMQEPADDPRAFCYVWAIYSNTDVDRDGFPIAVMYSLNYEVKDFHEGYGYLYQDLQSCAVRFQTELAAVGDHSEDIKGARCLRLTAFNKGCSSRTSVQDSHEDTLTICSMVWNAWGTKGVDTYMSIFDLNQWYKEQMPSSPQQNCSTYLSYICVSDIIDEVGNNSYVLDVLIDEGSINQFIGIQKPEEHYYPSALAYELCACSDKNIVYIYNKGQQRTLLGQFDSSGPLILLKPKEVFEQSVILGLTPLFAEPVHSDLNLHREFLLNIALEQGMIGFLWKCVCTWSNGSFTGVGCSIEFLLNWAWKRAILLKINADKLCETLFDYSEISLDANNRKILNSCTTQLSSLHRLYGLMCKKLQLSLSNIDIVQQQENCLHMIVTYLEVLQWLINIGLLPEFSESSTRKTVNRIEETYAPYPVETLLKYYKERRSSVPKETSLLYIDTLIEKEFGNKLQGLWQEDGGDGYYPPPSLQSLLRIYLMENVDMVHKHCIVIYLFLDLAMALDQLRFKFIITHLIKFPMVFRISSSITKIIQALWQLDHGDFPTAMDQLLDPHISTSDLEVWHHRVILNALLLQGQHNFALLYFQVRKPPLDDVQDILNVLSLYIENRMVDEAVNFCREHSSVENDTKLFRHVFQECTRTNQILEFVYYPLNLKEEEILMKYLVEISYDRIEEFRVNFYLHRSRYIDIFQIKKKEDKSFPSGLKGQKKMGSCENAMKVITNLFPKVTKDIFNICQHETTITQNKVSRPKPMSVFVHNADEKAKYKSTLIQAGILKSKEIWSRPVLNKSISESFPFIKTPTTSFELRKRASVVCPKVINANLFNKDEGISPIKRMKFTAEPSSIDHRSTQLAQDGNEINTPCFLDMSKLLTPIVKRKIHRESDFDKVPNEKADTCTPQSILKVKNIVTPQSFMNSPVRLSNASSKDPVINLTGPVTRAMGLTPRKSLSRSVVRFEKLQESSSTESPELIKTLDPVEMTDISNASKSSEANENSSQSVDTFYSPTGSDYDNEDKESADHPMKDVKMSFGREIPPVQTKSAAEVIIAKEQIKRILPKGRSSYRHSSPRLQTISTESVQISKTETKDFIIDEPEATPKRLTRSARVKLQESTVKSATLSSPRKTTLKIGHRHSFNKLVLEDTSTSVVSSQNFIPSESNAQLDEQSSIGNISSISSLASEELDRMVKGQSFSIPHISLSPMQWSASTVLDISDVSGNVEESALDSVNAVVANETDAKHENEQYRRSYMKVKGRKSLSRMVMERNLSTMYTSTPHHSFVEEATNESIQNSNKAGELSKLSVTDQLELDRLIKNQSYDIPDISLSLDHYSEDSNIRSENNSADRCTSQSIQKIHIESDSNLNRMKMDVHALPPRDSTGIASNSKLFKGNEPLHSKEGENLQINIKLDEVHFTAQESFAVGGEITGNDKDFKSNGNNQDKDSLPLQQNLTYLDEENSGEQNKEVVELVGGNTEEEMMHDDNILDTNLPGMENYANNELTRNSDDFNKTQFANNEVIEIPDTSSSCGSENSIESMSSNKYSDVDEEENEESIELTIDTNSEIVELDKNISAEFEDAEMEVSEIHTNVEFESPQSYEALVSDLLVGTQEHAEDEGKRRHISLVEEVILDEQHRNNENQVQLDGNEITTSSHNPNKDLENINNTSPEEGAGEVRADMSLDQTMKVDRDEEDKLQNTREHHSPQNDDNLVIKKEISMNENSKADISDYCNTNESDMMANQMHFLENRSIEASHVEDITVMDILDTVGVEKTTYVNISVTDILEKSLVHKFDDVQEEGNEQDLLKKEVSSKDYTTSGKNLGPLNELEGNDNVAELTQDHHKMQLRKRRLSNTSIESPSNRTLRKRSASTDEVTARRSKLMGSPSEGKDQGDTSKSQRDIKDVQSNPRVLRNRRAVSVSNISDIETETTLSSRKKSIRTASVSNLPIISEETPITNKGTSKKSENIKDEKQLQQDDLEIYSTSRRLTRHQKNLLERSRGKHSLAKICEGDVTQTEEAIGDNADKHTTPPVTEGRARIITRRISQESTSSIASTGNSLSDVGSPNKKRKTPQKRQTDSPQRQALRRGRSRSIDEVSVTSQVSKSSRTTRKSEVSDSDDQPTISLRRSTRNRSKTPDIEGSSKISSRSRKTLSKIPEEDNESKDVKLVKQEKSKKK